MTLKAIVNDCSILIYSDVIHLILNRFNPSKHLLIPCFHYCIYFLLNLFIK